MIITDEATVKALWERIEAGKARRAAAMPTVADALKQMLEAYERMKELGWRESIYAPKDGSTFETVECGLTDIFDCYYSGEWPDGYFNTMDGADCYSSRSEPTLFRPKERKVV